jgi:transposase
LQKEITEIKERLNQDSHNSSKPPSSDGYKKPAPKSLRKKSGKKPGGQPGHTGHGLKPVGEIKETIKLEPENCPCCGNSLHDVEGKTRETRYVHEIPKVKIETTVYESREKVCPRCGTASRGEFPETVKGTQQYGANLKAYIVMLSAYGMVGMRRIKALLESLFGVKISEGSIAGAVAECGKRLAGPVEEIKAAVLRAEAVHFDETGMRNRGVLWWLHTASTELLTYMRIHRKRGKEGMDACGILETFAGIAVHDCWKPYWIYGCVHALCNAHMLRELTGVIESTGQEWAGGMIALLLEMKKTVARYVEQKKGALSAYLRGKFSVRYDELVREGMRGNPAAEKEGRKRGKAKQGKARLLLERLEGYKEEYLRFSRDFRVPFDNNQAERDFRIAKVKQKVSGCFRSDKGAEAFAAIESFIQTMHKHHANIGEELVKVFQGPYSFPFDLMATE